MELKIVRLLPVRPYALLVFYRSRKKPRERRSALRNYCFFDVQFVAFDFYGAINLLRLPREWRNVILYTHQAGAVLMRLEQRGIADHGNDFHADDQES
jgi:hypothetical protein